MYSTVAPEVIRAVESLGAYGTLVGTFSCMGVYVLLKTERVSEGLVTQ
jgi:hypothetical protein